MLHRILDDMFYLLVDDGSINVQSRMYGARSVGIPLLGVVDQFNADTGCIRDNEESVFELQRTFDDFTFWRLGFTQWVFLQGEIGDTGCKLHAGCGTHRAQGIVWHHCDMVCLGQCSDLLAVCESTS